MRVARGRKSAPKEAGRRVFILVAKLGMAGTFVAHKGTVVGAEMCDRAVGLVAEIGRVVTGGAAGVERVGKNCR